MSLLNIAVAMHVNGTQELFVIGGYLNAVELVVNTKEHTGENMIYFSNLLIIIPLLFY